MLVATDDGAFLITPAQNTWAKMISKYFREVDNENTGQTKKIKIEMSIAFARVFPVINGSTIIFFPSTSIPKEACP